MAFSRLGKLIFNPFVPLGLVVLHLYSITLELRNPFSEEENE